MDAVKTLGIFWELHADVRATNEDRLQGVPLLLHFLPGGECRVNVSDLALPIPDDLQERRIVLHILIPLQIAKLNDGILETLHYRLLNLEQTHFRIIGHRVKCQVLHLPGIFDLGKLLLDGKLLCGAGDDFLDIICKLVQLEVE